MSFKLLLSAISLAGGSMFVPSAGAALVPEANVPLLYGFNDSSNSFGADATNGFGSFQAGYGTMLINPASSFIEAPAACGYLDGKFYAIRIVSSWWGSGETYLDIYDTETWESLGSNELKDINVRRGNGASFSKDGSKMYVMANNDWGDPYIYSIDLSTYETAMVMELPRQYYYTGMCGVSDTIFYVLCDHLLRKADAVSGEVVDTASLDYYSADTMMAYDAHDEVIYMNARGDDWTLHIFSVEPLTGVQTDKGPVGGIDKFAGIMVPTYPSAVPDAVSNVSFEYAMLGSTEATLTFDLPSVTYGCTTISGSLDAIIEIDGEKETVSGQAGEQVTFTKNLAEGMHTWRIYASNESGLSPERRFSSFAGVDAPGAVENLSLAISDTGKVTLTWDEPTKSANGGACDTSDLSYSVYRMPGNVLVSEKQKALSFTEELGDMFGHYSYIVVSYLGEAEGLSSTSEIITSGSVNVPPFVENFSDYTDFDRWSTENPADTYYGWTSYGTPYCNVDESANSDYYLFTPAIRLSQDETYTLTFDWSATGWNDLLSVMDVYLCSTPNSKAEPQMLLPELLTTSSEYRTYPPNIGHTSLTSKWTIPVHTMFASMLQPRWVEAVVR